MVQNMVTNTMDAMGTQLNTGLLTLYNGVFATVLAATGSSSIAKAAGTIAQASFIPSVKALSLLRVYPNPGVIILISVIS